MDNNTHPAFPIQIQRISAEQTIPLRHAVLWPDKPPSHVVLPEDGWAVHLGAFLTTGAADSNTTITTQSPSSPIAVITIALEAVPDVMSDESRCHPDYSTSSPVATPSGTNGKLTQSRRRGESQTAESEAIPGPTATTPRVAARFRKFARDPAYQGLGVGMQLLAHAFDVARRELGAEVIWCDARTTASLAWHQRRGLSPFGTRFWKGREEYVRVKADL